jgi:hypothetical protein
MCNHYLKISFHLQQIQHLLLRPPPSRIKTISLAQGKLFRSAKKKREMVLHHDQPRIESKQRDNPLVQKIRAPWWVPAKISISNLDYCPPAT